MPCTHPHVVITAPLLQTLMPRDPFGAQWPGCVCASLGRSRGWADMLPGLQLLTGWG